jgi:hypothetical protein
MLSTWLLRVLMAVSGAALAFVSWTYSYSAYEAQKADAIVNDLNENRQLDPARVRAGLVSFDRAVAIYPAAGRRLQRAELSAGVGLSPKINVPQDQRTRWLRRAKADLESGLAEAPMRGIDWLILATVYEGLDGPTRELLPALFMSIETAPIMPLAWPARLRVIVDVWPFLNEEQKARLGRYVVETWRLSFDKRYFVWAVHTLTDEMIIRYFLGNEPGAQDLFTKLIAAR